MKFDYDSQVDALDIILRDGITMRTVQVDRGTLLDLDAAGRLLSIEVIRPNRPWPLEQILEQYTVGDTDAAVLRALWGEAHATRTSAEPIPA